MSASFIVVPQWQGSSSSRAMRLVDGALAIRDDLPHSVTTTVEIPLEAGDEMGTGIARCGALRIVHDTMRKAFATATATATAVTSNRDAEANSWVLTIGGDCSVELGAIGHVLERAHTSGAVIGADEADAEQICVVWFDAHPDLNVPASSPSGAFAGMVLRALTGEGSPGLVPTVALDPRRIVLVGARDIDDSEADFIAKNAIQAIPASDLDTPQSLLDAIAATGATSVYIHIDLDVLDPSEIAGQDSPVPFGVSTVHLLAAIRAITARFALVGAGITQFAPALPDAATDDLPTILRIVGALTA